MSLTLLQAWQSAKTRLEAAGLSGEEVVGRLVLQPLQLGEDPELQGLEPGLGPVAAFEDLWRQVRHGGDC